MYNVIKVIALLECITSLTLFLCHQCNQFALFSSLCMLSFLGSTSLPCKSSAATTSTSCIFCFQKKSCSMLGLNYFSLQFFQHSLISFQKYLVYCASCDIVLNIIFYPLFSKNFILELFCLITFELGLSLSDQLSLLLLKVSLEFLQVVLLVCLFPNYMPTNIVITSVIYIYFFKE